MTVTLEAISEKLKTLTSADQFSDSIGTRFQASWGTPDSMDLELISATSIGRSAQRGVAREPFSLVFRAEGKQTYLAQGIYQLEHERHDILHLFLVPIGPDDTGMCFEAILN